MDLDIHDAVVMVVILTALGAVLSIWLGIRRIRKGRKLAYYRLRNKLISSGWWMVIFAPMLAGLAFLVGHFAEPIVYTYFAPSTTPSPTQTISLTSTISLMPTISEIPSITPTLAISNTPTITSTPFLPDVIAIQFTSVVTPNPAALFSPIEFSRTISNFLPVNPQTVFENPVGGIFATFSYKGMNEGAQWTALWYRDGDLVHYETEPWQGSTGGYQYLLWEPLAEEWLPGTYQVIMFVGMEWKVLGEFRVTGDPPTPTFTPSPTISQTSTQTLLPTITPRPSDTRWPTQTKTP
jgi:hypothetical protein